MRLPFATLLACLAALALPGAAMASVSITSFKLTPSTTQAGAHPDVTIDTAFSINPTSDDVKAVGVVLPQGLVGDPNAADRCPAASFNADTCPASSQVGTTSASATAAVVPGVVEIPQNVPGTVYNLQPKSGEAARLGIVLRPQAVNAVSLPKIFLQSGVVVGPQTGYGLATLFDGLPRTSGPFDIRLNSMELKLSGKAAHGPFLTNPTDCRAATTTASATSYDEPSTTRTASSSFTPTDCDKLPFGPHLAGSMGGQGNTGEGSSPTIITAVTVDPGGANPARVQVTLPPSLQVSFSSQVVPCPVQQFAAGACTAASHLGSASASSPLLPNPLTGPVTLISQTGGAPALAVQLGPTVPLTLFGQVGIGTTLTNTFDGIPDLPLSRFELTVDGGGRGLIANTGDLCRPGPSRTAHAQITAHSGATANLDADFAVVGCDAANPGSTVTEVGGVGRPRATLGLRFKRRRGTLTAKFRAGSGAPALTRARLALPRTLRVRAKYLRVTAGGRKVARRSLRVHRQSLDIRHRARTVTLRWTHVAPTGSLAKHLKRRPRVRFVARLTDGTPRTTRLRLTIRPGVRAR